MCWLAGLICGLVFFAFAGAPSTAAVAEEMVFETGSARFTYESWTVSVYPKVQTATITKIEPLQEKLVIPAVM